eukprot:TRINITY_DN1080_c0_g1_i10.p1 TRINITY_DN1080_c0_g1~~TRINITY_DN1080_c0_g1_i10.p1  ORF type:complete len:341 (-),score=118.30 TRINITY_DN1080_c0_g1_i10:82-1104(-)
MYWEAKAEGKNPDFESLKQHAQNGSKEAFDVLLKLAEEKEEKNHWSDEEEIKHPQAAKIVGDCYAEGWGVEKDIHKSIEWLGKALDFESLKQHAQNDSKEAFECYAEGWGVKKDLHKSIEWLGKALDFESLKQHAQNDSKEAFDVLLKLAEKKENGETEHHQAAKIVAECYAEGWGVKKDLHKSIEWLGKALDFESLKRHAQNGSKEAFDVLLKLAEETEYWGGIKHPQAVKIVAECYAGGWGVEKNAQKSIEWLGKILDFESLKQHAQNGSKDAFDVLLKLAEETEYWGGIKHPQAVKIVAECYAGGWGVEKNAQKAALNPSSNMHKTDHVLRMAWKSS